MSTSRTKVIVIICLSLCFGVILCIFGYTRIRSLLDIMEVGSNSQAPIRSLRLTIDNSQRGELFDQLRKFAKKHGFEYELTDFNTNGENFQFEMSRDDISIIAGDVPPDATLVFIRFYAKYPGYPVDEETIDALL
ncbi:MAG TPA: hypothetical protein VGA72_01720, partial [Anaerolineales bacterium]